MCDPIEEPAKAESSKQTTDQPRQHAVAFTCGAAVPEGGRRTLALGVEGVKLLVEAIERRPIPIWARIVRLRHDG